MTKTAGVWTPSFLFKRYDDGVNTDHLNATGRSSGYCSGRSWNSITASTTSSDTRSRRRHPNIAIFRPHDSISLGGSSSDDDMETDSVSAEDAVTNDTRGTANSRHKRRTCVPSLHDHSPRRSEWLDAARSRRRWSRERFDDESSSTEATDACIFCDSIVSERQYYLWKSQYTKSSFCSRCGDDNTGMRYISYWGTPSYEAGSWRKRYKAGHNVDIDLTPLVEVLARIDNMNTSMTSTGYGKNISTPNETQQTTYTATANGNTILTLSREADDVTKINEVTRQYDLRTNGEDNTQTHVVKEQNHLHTEDQDEVACDTTSDTQLDEWSTISDNIADTGDVSEESDITENTIAEHHTMIGICNREDRFKYSKSDHGLAQVSVGRQLARNFDTKSKPDMCEPLEPVDNGHTSRENKLDDYAYVQFMEGLSNNPEMHRSSTIGTDLRNKQKRKETTDSTNKVTVVPNSANHQDAESNSEASDRVGMMSMTSGYASSNRLNGNIDSDKEDNAICNYQLDKSGPSGKKTDNTDNTELLHSDRGHKGKNALHSDKQAHSNHLVTVETGVNVHSKIRDATEGDKPTPNRFRIENSSDFQAIRKRMQAVSEQGSGRIHTDSARPTVNNTLGILRGRFRSQYLQVADSATPDDTKRVDLDTVINASVPDGRLGGSDEILTNTCIRAHTTKKESKVRNINRELEVIKNDETQPESIVVQNTRSKRRVSFQDDEHNITKGCYKANYLHVVDQVSANESRPPQLAELVGASKFENGDRSKLTENRLENERILNNRRTQSTNGDDVNGDRSETNIRERFKPGDVSNGRFKPQDMTVGGSGNIETFSSSDYGTSEDGSDYNMSDVAEVTVEEFTDTTASSNLSSQLASSQSNINDSHINEHSIHRDMTNDTNENNEANNNKVSDSLSSHGENSRGDCSTAGSRRTYEEYGNQIDGVPTLQSKRDLNKGIRLFRRIENELTQENVNNTDVLVSVNRTMREHKVGTSHTQVYADKRATGRPRCPITRLGASVEREHSGEISNTCNKQGTNGTGALETNNSVQKSIGYNLRSRMVRDMYTCDASEDDARKITEVRCPTPRMSSARGHDRTGVAGYAIHNGETKDISSTYADKGNVPGHSGESGHYTPRVSYSHSNRNDGENITEHARENDHRHGYETRFRSTTREDRGRVIDSDEETRRRRGFDTGRRSATQIQDGEHGIERAGETRLSYRRRYNNTRCTSATNTKVQDGENGIERDGETDRSYRRRATKVQDGENGIERDEETDRSYRRRYNARRKSATKVQDGGNGIERDRETHSSYRRRYNAQCMSATKVKDGGNGIERDRETHSSYRRRYNAQCMSATKVKDGEMSIADTEETDRRRQFVTRCRGRYGYSSSSETDDGNLKVDAADKEGKELKWRTRGYNVDFYMSRQSVTGSEILDRYKKAVSNRRNRRKANRKSATPISDAHGSVQKARPSRFANIMTGLSDGNEMALGKRRPSAEDINTALQRADACSNRTSARLRKQLD